MWDLNVLVPDHCLSFKIVVITFSMRWSLTFINI